MSTNILVINAGSSSLKYALYEFNNFGENLLCSGLIEHIGEKGSKIASHQNAFQKMFIELKKICPLSAIAAVGHRVVHGGNLFYQPTMINDLVLKKLHTFDELAPLHNPYNLLGVKICRAKLKCPHTGIFDTGFHHGLPEKAKIYAIPYKYTVKDQIRRFGFHGISHEYVAREAAKILKRPFEKLKIITCHLGNGASMAAIDHGKSVDTSMGFTPLEGLVMGTRCGDVDPAIVSYLMQKERFSRKQIFSMLEHESGLKGICGHNDMREIFVGIKKGDKHCLLAFNIFCYRAVKYLSAYLAVLQGADAIVFTAGIGEHQHAVRHEIIAPLHFLGISLDIKKNQNHETIISTAQSSIPVFVIPTNEALLIARQTLELVKKKK